MTGAPSSVGRFPEALRLLRRFGAPHRRWLLRGVAGTLLVVACRIALPWPLRGVIEVVSSSAFGAGTAAPWMPSMAWIVAAYVAIAAVLGFAEMQQRVDFKAFAARTVHDLRGAVVKAVSRGGTRTDTADLISRVVGDSARVKAELSGILVHATQNGLLFAGICLLFAFLSPKLGLFFLLGGLFALATGYRATRRISAVTKRQREKEATYAAVVQAKAERLPVPGGRKLNEASVRMDVNATKLIGRAAWRIHVGLSVITAAALFVAVGEVQRGELELGELFLFLMYVVTVHRRMIQLGRQFARGGKLVANVSRLGELVQERSPVARENVSVPMVTCFEIRGRSRASAPGRSARLKPIRLTFERGSKTAIVGTSGAGKTTLLRVCAGLDDLEGEVHWDGRSVAPAELRAFRNIAFLPQAPAFGRRPLSAFVGEGAAEELHEATRRALDLHRLLRSCKHDSRTEVSSATLTRHEAQALLLAGVIRDGRADLWLVDDPVGGLSKKRASRRVEAILGEAAGRTVLVALPYGVAASTFDRIIVMKNGGVAFDGTPREWGATSSEPPAEVAPLSLVPT